MNLLEEIKLYLPKYLTPESEKILFKELKEFPQNIDSRLYTIYLKDSNFVYQGDGIEGLLYINLPDTIVDKVPAMVLSNTCDISPQNRRFFPPNLIYSPIFNLEKYKNALLEKGNPKQKVEDHLYSIKRQQITSAFYLPKGGSLKAESLVFFDRINSCDIDYMEQSEVNHLKLFTLSNYGLYLFVIKLSIHFTRIWEGFDRNKRNIMH